VDEIAAAALFLLLRSIQRNHLDNRSTSTAARHFSELIRVSSCRRN